MTDIEGEYAELCDETAEALEHAEDRMAALRAERDELQRKLDAYPYTSACFYCGHVTEHGHDAEERANAIVDHWETCERHPVHRALLFFGALRDLAIACDFDTELAKPSQPFREALNRAWEIVDDDGVIRAQERLNRGCVNCGDPLDELGDELCVGCGAPPA